MAHPTHAPLSALSIDKANVRKTGRAAEPIFAASIRAKGIIEPLIVRPNGKGFTITNGGKRFDGLQFLRKNGEAAAGIAVTETYPVPIAVRDENDADARDTSLITNIARSEMHPIDRYEAFAELVASGRTAADIAATYALTEREVGQALALGAKLSPKIREAWRAGELKTEAAQAFTLAPDMKSQDRVFDKLQKSQWHGLNAGNIRSEFKADHNDGGNLVEFVGIAEYEKRGGKVTRDLFGPNHVVSNIKLAKQMADERLDEICEQLVGRGWSWAATAAQAGNEWNYGRIEPKDKPTAAEAQRRRDLEKIINDDEATPAETTAAENEIEKIEEAIEARAFTPEQKLKSGCIVSLNHKGEISIQYGRVKPEEKRKVAAQERAKKKKKVKAGGAPEEPKISSALTHRLSQVATTAAAAAIKSQPDVALALLLAALMSNEGGAIDIRHNGMVTKLARFDYDDSKVLDFDKAYARVVKLKQGEQLKLLAELVGAAFDFQTWSVDGPVEPDVVAVVNAIDAKAMNVALRKEFDAEDYFGGVSKALCLAAITEAVNADEARKVSGKPKAEIAKFAVANVPKTGWLPEQLRTDNYDGPKAKAAKSKVKPAKKVAAKKRKAA